MFFLEKRTTKVLFRKKNYKKLKKNIAKVWIKKILQKELLLFFFLKLFAVLFFKKNYYKIIMII